MGKTFFSVDKSKLSELKPREGTLLVRDLLWCEASRLSLSRHGVVVSLDVTVADGGIDAKVVTNRVFDSLLIRGESHFQIKTGGSFKPWQPAMVAKELFGTSRSPSKAALGEAVRDCMNNGGEYVLVTIGIDLLPREHTRAVELLQQSFRACGYKRSRVQVLGQEQLASLLVRFPSLCLAVNDRHEAAFQTVESWSHDSEMTADLALGSAQEEFIASIQNALRTDDVQHVRVVGEPGLGKTRLVLEAISREPQLSARTLYVRQAADFQKSKLFTELLRPDLDYWALLVIDECDEDDRTSIWRALKGRRQVTLVTIDHGPEETSDPAMLTINMPLLDRQEIKEILSRYIGESNGLENWASWCEGSARVAHAVGENLKRNPEDVLKPTSTVPIWDRFVVGYRKKAEVEVGQFRTVLRHIALFQRFGFKPPVDAEGRFIATLAARVDPLLTYQRFASIVNHFVKRRVLQGGHTLRIVPKALHIHLWREWWEHYGNGYNLDELMREMPRGLDHWFLQLFIYAHGVESASYAIRNTILSPRGWFSDARRFASGEGTRLLSVLAEADPIATLRLLEATVGIWSIHEVTAWRGNRQNLVHALEKLAVWADLFERAATLMGRVTFGEKSTYSNNAKGTFVALFEPRSGPTQAPLSRRLALAKAFLTSDVAQERELGLLACKSVLNTRGSARIVGVEYQGMRPEVRFWQPQIWADLLEPWRDALQSLVDQTRNGSEASQRAVSNVVIEVCQGLLWSNLLPDQAVAALEWVGGGPHTDLEQLTRTVIESLRYGGHGRDEATTARLRALEARLAGETFMERLTRFVLYTIWQDDWTESGGEIQEGGIGASRIAELAKETVDGAPPLPSLLPKLLRASGDRLGPFGHQVAACAGDDRLDSEILDAVEQIGFDGDARFLSGFLRGVKELSLARWEGLCLQLLKTQAPPRWSVHAVVWSGLSTNVLDRLLELYLASSIDCRAFQVATLSGARTQLALGDVVRILCALRERMDPGSQSIAIGIADSRFCKPETVGQDPEGLLFEVLTAGDLLSGGAVQMVGYHWHAFAKRFRSAFPARDLPLLNAILAHADTMSSIRAASYPAQIADDICAANPTGTWPVVAATIAQSAGAGHALRSWLGDFGTFGRPGNSTMEHFEPTAVLEWIEGDIQVRAALTVDLVPQTLEPGRAGDLTRRFIERFADQPNISDHLIGRFLSGASWGARSDTLATKREDARRWTSAASSHGVRSWLSTYIEHLNARIDEAKMLEERGF